MLALKTDKEILFMIKNRIKQERVNMNIFQEDFAKKCLIPYSTYRKIEQTGECSLKNLIKILFVLKKIDDIDCILKPQEISLIDSMKKTKTKQKVTRRKSDC